MKIFYSELASNPGYFSFGYSIYAYPEENDTLSNIYEQGFLPAVVVTETTNLFYMSRGSRVVLKDFKELHKLHRVYRKFNDIKPAIEAIVHERKNFKITDDFVNFCLKYFIFRHGKESMPKERLLAILNSPFLTHISEYKIGNETVAYILEVHSDEFIHSWYYTYSKKYEGKHLGSYLLLDLIHRAKKSGKKYAYLGATYGQHMSYKCIYQPLEYWDGKDWVIDEKSKRLKKLLAMDNIRGIALSDAWREDRTNYYKPPYRYSCQSILLRKIIALSILHKKIFGIILIALGTTLAFLMFKTMF